ncbi:hypothetical protein [Streptomyces sp. NBC_00076]|uniref:hypothetical protein n=1 Tax=Streptomyces sp. NBC_00076 TaxID=2975642 RepID=UPI00324E6DB2
MSWTGTALVVLLAALVHVLGCAHGPAAAGAGRADALLVVATASCSQPAAPSGYSALKGLDPTEGGGPHCWSLDGPTAQPPRDISLLAEAAPSLMPAQGTTALLGQSGAQLPQSPTPPASSVQQERAQLGVWRT